MRLKYLVAAAAMTIAVTMVEGRVQAAPVIPGAEATDGIDVIPVQREDCHDYVRRHYLPDYGARVEHYHTGRRCRVVVVEDEEEDCHRDPDRHYVPEYGRSLWHRHTGRSCRVVPMREYRGDRRGEGCFQAGPVTICP